MKHHLHHTYLSDVYSLNTCIKIEEQIISRLEKLHDKKTSVQLIDKVYQSIFILDHNQIIIMVYYSNPTDYTEYKIGHVSKFLR